MSKITSFLVVILAVLAGMGVSPHHFINGILAGVVSYLAIEVFSLRRRISTLEEEQNKAAQVIPSASRTTYGSPIVEFDLETTEATAFPLLRSSTPQESVPIPTLVRPDELDAAPPQSTDEPPRSRENSSSSPIPGTGRFDLISRMFRYFTTGNLVLKIGIIVLFFGVAFLLKYAAQRNLIPIEFRLVGVALGGLALLALGWFLRRKHEGYGLGLEGGGIGILYLVIFAAAKLYHLLPLPLALAIMIGLVGLSCAMAVMQESKGLAVSGSIGGFLAPVLMSTGSGSHVMLFSYYALLNSGILGIAWFKAWRELNLVGFVFTFGIATFWGASAYVPAHFATTEPFLILFFLMFAVISVLFALRQPLQLRGFIDGPLVFGLPIVAAGLQAYLVRDFRYGMALSALAFGFWYIGLARLLWNRMANEMRLVTEAFLALGVVFASLAIPLGLDHHWTTAAWALEGAAMIWVGIRQNRKLARIFGILLQLGAALTFVDKAFYPPDALLFGNHFFLGCALIALAALFSSYQLDSNHERCSPWETQLPLLFLVWGLIWWYFGGVRDLDRHIALRDLPAVILLFTCVSTIFAGFVARRLPWQRLALALLLLLPIMLLTILKQTVGWGGGPLLISYGWIAWPLAFCLQYGLLAFFEEDLPEPVVPIWHALSLWLLILAPTIEIVWRVLRISGLANTWSIACWGLIPTALLFALAFRGNRLTWPVCRFARIYHGIGSGVPLLGLLLWCLISFGLAGDPRPLAYIPVLNPLELIELSILLLAGIRSVHKDAEASLLTGSQWLVGRYPRWLVAGMLFLWFNAVAARCVHFFSGISFSFNTLFASAIFQATIAALWSILALAMTVWGAKKEQRIVWEIGAGLLAMVVLKLFLIDLSGTGTIGRIVSFLVVGLLMLIIGYFAPLPPKSKANLS